MHSKSTVSPPIQETPPVAWARTHVGRRQENQDHFGRADSSVPGYDWRGMGSLYAVADGMGGLDGGREAARIAIQALIDGYKGQRPGIAAANLKAAVALANLAVVQFAAERGISAGSTVVACVLKDGIATFAHVGDSRVYHLRAGNLCRRTIDHLPGVESGIPDDDLKRGPGGNKISRALGQSDDVQIDVSEAGYCPGDSFMLCSDGLSGVVQPDQIRTALLSSSPKVALSGLFSAAEATFDDNATGVAIFAPKHERSRWRVLAVNVAIILISAAIGAGSVYEWPRIDRFRHMSYGWLKSLYQPSEKAVLRNVESTGKEPAESDKPAAQGRLKTQPNPLIPGLPAKTGQVSARSRQSVSPAATRPTPRPTPFRAGPPAAQSHEPVGTAAATQSSPALVGPPANSSGPAVVPPPNSPGAAGALPAALPNASVPPSLPAAGTPPLSQPATVAPGPPSAKASGTEPSVSGTKPGSKVHLGSGPNAGSQNQSLEELKSANSKGRPSK